MQMSQNWSQKNIFDGNQNQASQLAFMFTDWQLYLNMGAYIKDINKNMNRHLITYKILSILTYDSTRIHRTMTKQEGNTKKPKIARL